MQIATQSPQPAVVARTANELGVLTPGGRPWTASDMARKLISLGVHSVNPRRQGKRQKSETPRAEIADLACQSSSAADAFLPTVRDESRSEASGERQGDSSSTREPGQ